jgi:transcription antitermination factor NusG
MESENENVFWYVLFAVNGKAAKINHYLTKSNVECFFPLVNKEQRIRNSERTKPVLQPLFGNLVFVKSSKECLTPLLREIRERFNITDDLYYRYREGKKRIIIVVPEKQMRDFIAIAGCTQKRVIYLSNDEVNFEQGTKIRIIGGTFEGVEGIFLKIKGKNRVIVSLPNLLSVSTAFIPTRFIVPLE